MSFQNFCNRCLRNKHRILLILLFIIPNTSQSTCIVIEKVDNKVYIAADSRSYVVTKDKVFYDTICKIHQVNNYHFVISGYSDYMLFNTASKSLKHNKDINQAMQDFADSVKENYRHILYWVKDNQKSTYHYNLHADYLAAVCFIYNKNGAMTIDCITFKIKENEDGNIMIGTEILQNIEGAKLGFRDHINDSLIERALELTKGRFDLALEKMVKIEISHHKKYIAAPIDRVIKLQMEHCG